MRNQTVIAAELPAPCPLQCLFCRTPQHGEGDTIAVQKAIWSNLNGSPSEVYLTSNGETGLAKGFSSLVQDLTNKGHDVAVLCATECSVVPGLTRVEVSYNRYVKAHAEKAIAKAKALGIPVVLSLVNDTVKKLNPESIALEYDVDGVLIRALQAEGRSTRSMGETQVWQKPRTDLGVFPNVAYRELEGHGERPICLNSEGQVVVWLGGELN